MRGGRQAPIRLGLEEGRAGDAGFLQARGPPARITIRLERSEAIGERREGGLCLSLLAQAGV